MNKETLKEEWDKVFGQEYSEIDPEDDSIADWWLAKLEASQEQARLEERNRIIKAIKEKGLHLGYKNDILDIINSLKKD